MTAPAKIQFSISGIGCPDCVAVIENAVMPLAGVAFVGVSLSTETMTIRPGAGLDVPDVVRAVQALGYGVRDYEERHNPQQPPACRCRST